MIRTKDNITHLKNIRGRYAYSYVNECGHPVDLNIVADTWLDDEGCVDGVTYCRVPDVDGKGNFDAFNTCRDRIDEDSEHSCDIIIYTKEEVGEIIKRYNTFITGIRKMLRLRTRVMNYEIY